MERITLDDLLKVLKLLSRLTGRRFFPSKTTTNWLLRIDETFIGPAVFRQPH